VSLSEYEQQVLANLEREFTVAHFEGRRIRTRRRSIITFTALLLALAGSIIASVMLPAPIGSVLAALVGLAAGLLYGRRILNAGPGPGRGGFRRRTRGL
jgi:hypothetical protein